MISNRKQRRFSGKMFYRLIYKYDFVKIKYNLFSWRRIGLRVGDGVSANGELSMTLPLDSAISFLTKLGCSERGS